MEFQVNLSLNDIQKVLCKECKAEVQKLLDREEEKIKQDFEAWRKGRAKR